MLSVGSLVLILPSCAFASLMLVGLFLTTRLLGTILWDLVLLLVWLPAVVIGLGASSLVATLLLSRFPLLRPALLVTLGIACVAVIACTGSLWWDDARWGGAVALVLGFGGALLAAAWLWQMLASGAEA